MSKNYVVPQWPSLTGTYLPQDATTVNFVPLEPTAPTPLPHKPKMTEQSIPKKSPKQKDSGESEKIIRVTGTYDLDVGKL